METSTPLTIYRGCTPVIDAEYGPGSDSSATQAVLWALADAIGVDPVELPPIGECVDLNALDALFNQDDRATDRDKILSFQVDTWNVFVRSDGRIRICDATKPTHPEPVFESPPV